MTRKPSDEPENALSSPPCFAADFPGHFGEGSEAPVDAVLIERLNTLLEAERAGAKVLAILRDGLDQRSSVRHVLERLQKDEGANAVLLYKTIQRLGGVASHDTGAFVHKTLAIEGLAARLDFLNKGQAWVVRKIDEALPDVSDPAARAMLEQMRRSHVDNIAACASLTFING
jgi:nitronate monooxygenase